MFELERRMIDWEAQRILTTRWRLTSFQATLVLRKVHAPALKRQSAGVMTGGITSIFRSETAVHLNTIYIIQS